MMGIKADTTELMKFEKQEVTGASGSVESHK